MSFRPLRAAAPRASWKAIGLQSEATQARLAAMAICPLGLFWAFRIGHVGGEHFEAVRPETARARRFQQVLFKAVLVRQRGGRQPPVHAHARTHQV